tara:strand:+ start:438 stop:740 length:303 start_codon:yes stop_codon:yes gene_type:complete
MLNLLEPRLRTAAIADMRLMIGILSDDKKISDAAEVLERHNIEFDGNRVEQLTYRSVEVLTSLNLMNVGESSKTLRTLLDKEKARLAESRAWPSYAKEAR